MPPCNVLGKGKFAIPPNLVFIKGASGWKLIDRRKLERMKFHRQN